MSKNLAIACLGIALSFAIASKAQAVRTIERLTKFECWYTPGAIDWREYSNQGRIPKDQRLGTCYVED
jgi:hypothetical protein